MDLFIVGGNSQVQTEGPNRKVLCFRFLWDVTLHVSSEEMAAAIMTKLLECFPGLAQTKEGKEPGALLNWLSNPEHITPELITAIREAVAAVKPPNESLHLALTSLEAEARRLKDHKLE